MKYALLLSFLLGGGGFYVRTQQPTFWNEMMARYLPTSQEAVASQKTFRPPNPLPVHPNWTWTTTDGKTYQDVVVRKVEPDCVTILDHDGGARINTSTLPADIQTMLNYDPTSAREANEKRAEADKDSAAAFEQEYVQGEQVQQRKLAELDRSGSEENQGLEVTDEQAAGYRSDLGIVMGHVQIDRLTGRVVGDAYYVNRYEEDQRFLARHERERAEGRVPSPNAGQSSQVQTAPSQNARGAITERRSESALPSTTKPASSPSRPPPAPSTRPVPAVVPYP